MLVNGVHYRTIWMEDRTVKMIDQLALPYKFEIFGSQNHRDTAHAIRTMVIRGAGAIGAAGGYGMAQAALEAPAEGFAEYVAEAARLLKSTRPTAQNLFYAVDRVHEAIKASSSIEHARIAGPREAGAVAGEDTESCRRIGEAGARLIMDGTRVLTHCNAGWLGFSDWGTALAPLYWARREGRKPFVWVDETRPRLQGARLTAWELAGEGIDFRLIADNAAGYFMRRKEVDLVIVGSDRIAVNGDVANKIGTYEKALLAKENGIPFYVAAPMSTVDAECPNGDSIPIEERDETEVLTASGPDDSGEIRTVRISIPGVRARNPAFDVTPARLVTGIITELGIVRPKELPGLISKRAGRSPSCKSG